ncbi:CRISPR-associated endonuclease Cas1 [uncultured Selenomonas sp.]|uniref:CRISPR-associated endonuclease Cas1 n=1 Tax=uncultured Selenomonas sp. TaxID=159275 RepID=UPI0028E8733E|nr:CRISPR-associated endonuclease Cas1 [uncultured Selenomonas sp.]
MSFAYITEEGAYIQKRGGNFTVGRNRECIMEIPVETLEGLTLIDTVQVSSRAIVELLRLGIPVTWLSRTGYFFGRLESTRHVNVFRQERQVFLRGTPFALAMARKVIAAKAHNQLILLRRYNRNAALPEVCTAVADIEALSKRIMTCDTNEQLMGYEGAIAKVYFGSLGQLVPAEFAFAKRTRRPPMDPFNAMLSFGYTLLMYDIYTALSNEGLHPYFGFLHAVKNRHPALASDLMEEWRAALIDAMTLSLVHHHEIKQEHFSPAESEDTPGIFLTREGRAIFLRAYEKKMRAASHYGSGRRSYRHALAHQARQYAQALMAENADIYEPVWLR